MTRSPLSMAARAEELKVSLHGCTGEPDAVDYHRITIKDMDIRQLRCRGATGRAFAIEIEAMVLVVAGA